MTFLIFIRSCHPRKKMKYPPERPLRVRRQSSDAPSICIHNVRCAINRHKLRVKHARCIFSMHTQQRNSPDQQSSSVHNDCNLSYLTSACIHSSSKSAVHKVRDATAHIQLYTRYVMRQPTISCPQGTRCDSPQSAVHMVRDAKFLAETERQGTGPGYVLPL